jgi:hypothetical protein
MSIDQQNICDFVWAAGAHTVDSFKTNDFELSSIDAMYHRENNYGVVNKTYVIINHEFYTITYQRIWPDWTSTDRITRMIGTITATLQGNEDIFMQHLMVLKLS